MPSQAIVWATAMSSGYSWRRAENKSWMFRFTSPVTRKAREMGLGPVTDIKLAEARDAAQQARKLVLAGKDPIAERNAERAAVRVDAAKATTFEEFAKQYVAIQKPGWRNPKHAQQWENTLKTYAYPVMGRSPFQMSRASTC